MQFAQPERFTGPKLSFTVNPRNLSSDGNRVFFESADKLVAGDVNGVNDVYEWEAKGSGSCASDEQNGGCLYLISSGTSPEPSFFGDASLSGDDVFIFTRQGLVGQDKDELIDVYDARVGGGIAAQNPLPLPVCEGEACRSQSPELPVAVAPGSSTFSGPPDPKPRHKKKKPKKHHGKKHHGKNKKSGKKHNKSQNRPGRAHR